MEVDTIDLNSDKMETVQSDSYSDSDGSIFRFLNIRPPESEKKIHEDSMEKDQIERSLHFDWDTILDKMEECYSYKQLADYVNTLELPDVELKEKDTMTGRDDVDPLSLFIFPSDGPKGLEPVKTLGDGNCLYRSIVHLAFGDEERHKEVRVGVTVEAVKNKHLYIDGEYLYRGSLRRNPKMVNISIEVVLEEIQK